MRKIYSKLWNESPAGGFLFAPKMDQEPGANGSEMIMRITVEAIENPQMGIYPSFFVSYDLCEKMHNLV